ncbi:MAG: hypothetical protein HUK15_00190, partial [Bacteroidales bacterium]|nr:hypothetical protein [Bacteroidales bacterium]
MYDDFDDTDAHPNFTINSQGNINWQYNDADNLQTGGISGYVFPNNREKMAFMTITPSEIYSEDDFFDTKILPHSGSQFIASFRGVGGQTDDWIISPQLNFVEDFEFSFFVRGSDKPSYWETMEVFYFTESDTIMIDSCMIKGSADPNSWTEKSYTVPESAKFVAIRNYSQNRNFLCIDDIKISGNINAYSGGVNVYENGNLVARNINDTSYCKPITSIGDYCYYLQSACDENIVSDTILCFHAEQDCQAPSYAICKTSQNTDSIFWAASPNALSYNIYLDGQIYANTSDTIFVTNHNNQNYSISSVCSYSESELIEPEYIITSMEDDFSSKIEIYPNPFEKYFSIKHLG